MNLKFQEELVQLNFGSDNKKVKILFASDMHVIALKDGEDARILAYEKERAEGFVSMDIPDTREMFLGFVEYANLLQPDMVVFGGDIIDCPSQGNLTFLAEQLKRLEMPYVYTTGNHDWNFSWEYLEDSSRERNLPFLCKAVGMNLEACYREIKGIQFLTVDSSRGNIAIKALDILEECHREKPLCIVMHVPFSTVRLREMSIKNWGFETTMGGGALPIDDVTEHFYEKLAEFEQCIIFGGHVHGFDNQVLGNGAIQIVAPAGCQGKVALIEL